MNKGPMWINGMDLNTWNAAIRTAAKLVAPRGPLKDDADAMDRLAHKVSELDEKHILALLDQPQLAVKA